MTQGGTLTQGFAFHRNGDISYTDRHGETYWLYYPTIGQMREVEEYGAELAEQINKSPAKVRADEYRDQIAEGAKIEDDEATELLNEFNRLARDHSVKWFVRVIQVCGSDNWPRQIDKGTGKPMKDEHGRERIDIDALPGAIRNRQLVTDIKNHWAEVPLAESPNGATKAENLAPT